MTVAIEKKRTTSRRRESGEEEKEGRTEKRQTERGKVHPVDGGGPAPPVFCKEGRHGIMFIERGTVFFHCCARPLFVLHLLSNP